MTLKDLVFSYIMSGLLGMVFLLVLLPVSIEPAVVGFSLGMFVFLLIRIWYAMMEPY